MALSVRIKKIAYRALTALLVFIMGGSGVADVLRLEEAVVIFTHLGYPSHMLIIVGVAKVCGALAIVFSPWKFLKEWAYAGFAIDLIGAAASHYAVGDGAEELAKPLGVFVLSMTSYMLWKRSEKP